MYENLRFISNHAHLHMKILALQIYAMHFYWACLFNVHNTFQKCLANYFKFSSKTQRANEWLNAINFDTNSFNWEVEHRLIAIFKRFNEICRLKPYDFMFTSTMCQTNFTYSSTVATHRIRIAIRNSVKHFCIWSHNQKFQ